MKVVTKAKVLSAESKPWDMNGMKGTSHKVRFLIDTEIFPCKTTEQLVQQFSTMTGKDVTVELDFTSVKEDPGVTLVGLKV